MERPEAAGDYGHRSTFAESGNALNAPFPHRPHRIVGRSEAGRRPLNPY